MWHRFHWFVLGLTFLVIGQIAVFGDASQESDLSEGFVRAGMLVYGEGKTGLCFSDRFLTDLARRTTINIKRKFEAVHLRDDAIYHYPFIVMSGSGSFALSPEEQANLKAYLTRGGFLLASAGCSSKPWAMSFQKIMDGLFPDQEFTPLTLDHPLFHTIYNIDRIPSRKKSVGVPAVLGLYLGDRLSVVYSPLGLNDTARAGGGCCCCGGNEIRHAAQINANALVYALTH